MYDDIMLFIKVAEIGNFHNAAQILNLSQPTITRRIQSLEYNLQLTLLDRNCRTLKLTTEGNLVYEKFAAQKNKLRVLLEDVKVKFNGALQGVLRVGVPATNIKFATVLPLFTILYPKVQIIIYYINHQIDLAKDNLDIAISTMKPKPKSNTATLLTKSNLKLYASANYIKNHGLPTSIKDLTSNHQLVIFRNEDGLPQTKYHAKNLQTNKETIIELTSNVCVSNTINSVYFAKTGHYIIFYHEHLAEEFVATNELIPVLPELSFDELQLYLITNITYTSKLENAFIEYIQEDIRKRQELLKQQ